MTAAAGNDRYYLPPMVQERLTTNRPAAAAEMVLTRREKFSRWRYRHRHAVEGWLIMTPILAYFSAFFFFPVVSNFLLSFTKWSGLSGAPAWVGLTNYRRYLTDPTYIQVITNTVVFAVLILVIQTALALLIALLLNAKVRARGIFRSAWYVPTLTSAAIMAQVTAVFIAPSGGVINSILSQLNLPPVIFYVQVDWMRAIIIVYSVWRGVGGPMLLYLAA